MNGIHKNRNRDQYTFANINLLGKCNADCYFCLGKDIPELLNRHNQMDTHFSEWRNFMPFLDRCKKLGIEKLYLTGQNTDPLLYRYVDGLADGLIGLGFRVGIRTNGYLADRHIHMLRMLNDEIGFSINSLDPETNRRIMGRADIPDWDSIIPAVKSSSNTVRVATVVNRYNADEVKDIIRYVAGFPEVLYHQIRRVSTDTRLNELMEDVDVYESVYQSVADEFGIRGDFNGAQRIDILGKETCWWRTVETTTNSLNYFTDGTCSDNYFIVEGYKQNYVRTGEVVE